MENKLVTASVKTNSTADVTSGIFRNFRKTQSLRLQFVGLLFTKKELYYRPLPRNFLKKFKAPLKGLVRSLFLVDLQLVGRKPTTPSQRELSRNF